MLLHFHGVGGIIMSFRFLEAIMSTAKRTLQTKTVALAGLMTALVIILQLLGSFTTFFGPFSTAVALIPIVIGAAMCGVGTGAWLGFVFGMVVLLSGGANLFFMFSVPGTIITVLVKGTACGLVAGITYKLLKKVNEFAAVLAAALLCPITNTGVFLLGCAVFFLKDAASIASVIGSTDTGMALFLAMAMANFLLEIVSNVVLSPVVVRLLGISKKAK